MLGALIRILALLPVVTALEVDNHSLASDTTFTNVTAQEGIAHKQAINGSSQNMTGGAVAGDFDGDGRVDLIFTRVAAANVFYHNTGTGFVDVSRAAGFTTAPPSNGIAAGDIDNDGDLDLYVTGSEASQYYLYINDGAGHFSEQSIARGADVSAPAGQTRRGQGAAFGDYDGDGYLDILTTDYSRPMASSGSRLLHNLGAANPGHFDDVTHAAGLDVYRQPMAIADTAFRFTPQFSDIDRDGKQDILFSADSHTSQLFWNNGDGTFTDGTIAAGVGTDKSGMGSAIGDFDGDGKPDWFVTAIFDTPVLAAQPGNRLYHNNGNRTFTDVTSAAGVRKVGWGWGTTFFDFDNDGKLDLMATNGFPAGFPDDPTTLWRNNGDGTFADVSLASGITDTGEGRGLLTLDYDNDGDLDVVVVNNAATPILYRNDGGNQSNWLRVKTRGTVSNRDGVGAWITLTVDINHPENSQTHEISSGGSFLSQSELTAQFGLGDHSGTVDLVTIAWPSGVLQRFTNVAVDSLLLAQEPLPGDANGDGVVDSNDLAPWMSEFGAIGSGQEASGDFNGDGATDGADFLAWQRYLGKNASVPATAVTAPEPVTALQFLLAVMVAGARLKGNSKAK